MDDLEISGGESGIDRRDFMRKSAIVGGIVWAAPMISSFSRPAFAGTFDIPGFGACEFDEDGNALNQQPTGLEWRFDRPNNCSGDGFNNDQAPKEGDVGTPGSGGYACTGEANGSATLTVEITGAGNPPPVDVPVGNGSVTFYSNGETGQAGSWTDFTVKDEDGEVIHAVRVHTSCSLPLAIGDQFGAFTLIGGTFLPKP